MTLDATTQRRNDPETNMSSKLTAFAARMEAPTYAALRIVAGVAFSFHGMQKIFGWLSPFMPPLGSQLWFGGLIELVGGILIAIGLFTRPAAFLASGTMAVAYTQFHWKLSFAESHWLPAINKGEPALLYCFLFLFIAARGAGIASVASARAAGRARSAPHE